MAKEQQGPQREVKWDERTVKNFIQEFFALMEKGNRTGVPNPVMESACRDWLAMLEAARLATPLIGHWKNMGVAVINLKDLQ